tara:strand:+ start:911 stop:1036 length:126 start_codon:yes stop_codon:yes gene_type:complete
MNTKFTNKEIRSMLFDPEFFGLTDDEIDSLETTLFNRTGEV